MLFQGEHCHSQEFQMYLITITPIMPDNSKNPVTWNGSIYLENKLYPNDLEEVVKGILETKLPSGLAATGSSSGSGK